MSEYITCYSSRKTAEQNKRKGYKVVPTLYMTGEIGYCIVKDNEQVSYDYEKDGGEKLVKRNDPKSFPMDEFTEYIGEATFIDGDRYLVVKDKTKNIYMVYREHNYNGNWQFFNKGTYADVVHFFKTMSYMIKTIDLPTYKIH